jgi:hypothetical protein
MDKSRKKNLREQMWRCNVHSVEEAELTGAADAESGADFQEEAGLNYLLDQVPDAPISSNFTSRVLQAVALEEAKISREQRGWPAWRVGFGWVSRLAIAGFSILIGVVSFHEYQAIKRVQLAESVEQVSQVAALPADWLENFDTIKHLSQPPVADEDLLAMLQ